MKSKKAILILYCFIFIFIFSMTILLGTSYYYNHIKDNSDIIRENNVLLLVDYDKKDKITLSNIKYNYDETFTFKVNNFSKDTISNYKVIFDIITPASNMVDEDFVYTLTSKSVGSDKSNIVVNKTETPIPIISKEIGIGKITPLNTHEYSLNIKLKNKKNNYLIKTPFVGVIKIENISQ